MQVRRVFESYPEDHCCMGEHWEVIVFKFDWREVGGDVVTDWFNIQLHCHSLMYIRCVYLYL